MLVSQKQGLSILVRRWMQGRRSLLVIETRLSLVRTVQKKVAATATRAAKPDAVNTCAQPKERSSASSMKRTSVEAVMSSTTVQDNLGIPAVLTAAGRSSAMRMRQRRFVRTTTLGMFAAAAPLASPRTPNNVWMIQIV